MLKVFMLRRKIDQKKRELETLQGVDFETRRNELRTLIEEAQTEEEQQAVEEAVEAFDQEEAANKEAQRKVSEEIAALEADLEEKEAEQETPAAPEPEPEKPEEERKEAITMNTRSIFAKMNVQERTALFESDSMKNWLGEIRTAIKEKRAIANAGLTIPVEVLPLLRENIQNWSKLYGHSHVVAVAGEARQPIMGAVPEAIWTECCSTLNELNLAFNDWTMDCFKVGGYYALCKANAEDSDIDLAAAVIEALGQAIGKALDKAELFGRNTTANSKMPLGVVTRLLQTEQPADYPSTARAWTDLHTTNVANIADDENLLVNLVENSALAASDYSRGELVWVMNEKTYKKIVAHSLNVNAAGAVVAGIDGRMPVVGGIVETLNFIPDGVIVFGYFDCYVLAERAGREFASSEHVRFIQDQIVYRGTARYDGAPVIAEAFGIITIGSATVTAASVTFPQDTAN